MSKLDKADSFTISSENVLTSNVVGGLINVSQEFDRIWLSLNKALVREFNSDIERN